MKGNLGPYSHGSRPYYAYNVDPEQGDLIESQSELISRMSDIHFSFINFACFITLSYFSVCKLSCLRTSNDLNLGEFVKWYLYRLLCIFINICYAFFPCFIRILLFYGMVLCFRRIYQQTGI